LPLNANQVYRASLIVESVGDSDHFRVSVTYDPPIPELGLLTEFDPIPTSYGVVSNLVPIILAENPIDLGQNDESEHDSGLDASDNVVDLFPTLPTTDTVN
jgi:hypothetical protein